MSSASLAWCARAAAGVCDAMLVLLAFVHIEHNKLRVSSKAPPLAAQLDVGVPQLSNGEEDQGPGAAAAANDEAGAQERRRMLLRCGECDTIFGLPAHAPAEAVVRCPHCNAINRQPPTFTEKLCMFQARMAKERQLHQRQVSQHG
jgi:phage FluMu protein Com